MVYAVTRGTERFGGLGPKAALAKARELIAEDVGDVYLFDSFGDPMGLVELEHAVESVRYPDNA